MERSRGEVDLADWYGNSWAKSQKIFFVAVWLVFTLRSSVGLLCSIQFAEMDVIVYMRFSQVKAMVR